MKFRKSDRTLKNRATLQFRDQFSLLTCYLLAYVLLAYLLFISTYKAHINAIFSMTP